MAQYSLSLLQCAWFYVLPPHIPWGNSPLIELVPFYFFRFFKAFFPRVFIYLLIYLVFVLTCTYAILICGGQRTIFGSWFSPSVMWTPGIEFRLLGSVIICVCV